MAHYSAPTYLLEDIVKDIKHRQTLAALRNTALGIFGFLCSVAAFYPSFKLFSSDIQRSGFITFFSLLFSDSSVMVKLWQSFTMMLLESFPAISFALLLVVLLVILQSSIALSKNVKWVLKIRH